MKVVYLNVKEGKEPEVIDIKNELSEFYKLIDCRHIDITYRKMRGKTYAVVCDDEGLLKEKPIVSFLTVHPFERNLDLVGNIVIANIKEDDLDDLTDEDVENIMRSKARYGRYVSDVHPVLMGWLQ